LLVIVKMVKSCLNEILDCVEAVGDDGDDYFEDESVADNAEVYVSFGVEVIGTLFCSCVMKLMTYGKIILPIF
jgi:hypothetical protein